jgi:hypothetical protein
MDLFFKLGLIMDLVQNNALSNKMKRFTIAYLYNMVYKTELTHCTNTWPNKQATEGQVIEFRACVLEFNILT